MSTNGQFSPLVCWRLALSLVNTMSVLSSMVPLPSGMLVSFFMRPAVWPAM